MNKQIKLIKIILMISFVFLGLIRNSNGQIISVSAASKWQSQKDKPLKIKNKPQPQFTQNDCSSASGVSRFKVKFDKSAEITSVEMVSSSGCKRFDENSIKAAYKIKFTPAEKDGQPITVVKVVEYAFSTY